LHLFCVFAFTFVLCNRSFAYICTKSVTEIHDDLEKAKKESRKDRIPPRAPKDKPTILEGKEDTLEYAYAELFLYHY